MYIEKGLDITVQINDGPEVPVHLSGPGLLGACTQVMRSEKSQTGSTSYNGELQFTVGLFDCQHTNEHDRSYGKSVWVIITHSFQHGLPDRDFSAQVTHELEADFNEGTWGELEFTIPLPQFRQYSVEPQIERPPLKVKIRRAGELTARRFEVSGHRRRRILTPVD